jgi:GMC oxidoreductase
VGVEAVALDARSVHPTGRTITVDATCVVAAGGAINTPGLLLRSKLPDPHGRLGTRTFIHPVNASVALMPDPVDGFAGAPQSTYSDQFLWRDGVTGRVGFKLEAAPTYPMLSMAVTGRLGRDHLRQLAPKYRHYQLLIALLRDGFSAESQGGHVLLKSDGSPLLDYPVTDYLWEGLWDAYLRMAEVQFAAGATQVTPAHMAARPYTSLAEVKAALATLPRKPVQALLFTAHLMGGCAMGSDPRTSVINSDGRHHQVEGLAVIDGSMFPTGLGVNPQITIYGIAARNATKLAQDLGGKVKAVSA